MPEDYTDQTSDDRITGADIVDGNLIIRRFDGSEVTFAPLAGGPFAPIDSPTFEGEVTSPLFGSSGLTGAVAPSRYAGATTSGAPTTGTFAVGDFVIDHTGILWICVTAGTPGTWVDASSSGHELARATAVGQQIGITTETDLTGLAISFTVGARPVEVVLHIPSVGHTVTATTVTVKLTDNANTLIDPNATASYRTKAANDYGPVMIRHEFAAGAGPVTVKARALSAAGASQGFITPTGATERRTLTAIAR